MLGSEIENDDTPGTRAKGRYNVLHDSFHHRALKRVVHVENEWVLGEGVFPGVHLYELDLCASLLRLRPAPEVVLGYAIERRGEFDPDDFLEWQEGGLQDGAPLARSQINEQEFFIGDGESCQQLSEIYGGT